MAAERDESGVRDQRQDLGLRGERLAEAFLRKKGLKTVARRFATPAGEIDLIERDRDTLVFVEVKTRADDRLAEPEQAVNAGKQRKLAAAARFYVNRNQLTDAPCRFDVVAVILPADGQPRVNHFPDAFVPKRW